MSLLSISSLSSEPPAGITITDFQTDLPHLPQPDGGLSFHLSFHVSPTTRDGAVSLHLTDLPQLDGGGGVSSHHLLPHLFHHLPQLDGGGGVSSHHLSLHLSPHLPQLDGCGGVLPHHLSLGHLSLGFPSLFLLNVLENQGNPSTNHFAPPFTASCHGYPGTTVEISKNAWLILDAASWATAESIFNAVS